MPKHVKLKTGITRSLSVDLLHSTRVAAPPSTELQQPIPILLSTPVGARPPPSMGLPAPRTDECGTQILLPALANENQEEIFILLPGPTALARASICYASFLLPSPMALASTSLDYASSCPAPRRTPVEVGRLLAASALPRTMAPISPPPAPYAPSYN